MVFPGGASDRLIPVHTRGSSQPRASSLDLGPSVRPNTAGSSRRSTLPPKVLTHRKRLGVIGLYTPTNTMGQQLNKIIKRKRRAAYLKRKKAAATAAKKK